MSTKKLQLLENIFPANPQTGQVLSIDENGNKVWSALSEDQIPDSIKDFDIHVTLDEQGNIISADKTFAEISAAIDAGKQVFVVDDGTKIPYMGRGTYQIDFGIISMSTYMLVYVNSYDKWTVNIYNVFIFSDLTSADNGKILSVVDGYPTWTENSSGAALPQVTSSDNGKILQVVNGGWTAVSITDANNTSY